MPDTKDFKTKSFRVDDDTFNKFKEICKDFENQGECFQQIISCYELSLAKKSIPPMETNIKDFQTHIDYILKSYLNSLEVIQNTENRIRLDFQNALQSKDNIIIDLQNKITSLNDNIASWVDEKNNLNSLNTSLTTENNDLHKEILSLQENISASKNEYTTNIEALQLEYKNKLKDKDTINHTLSEINNTLKNEITTLEKNLTKMQDMELLNDTLNKQLSELQKSFEDISTQNNILKSQIETLEQNQQESLKSVSNQHKLDLNTLKIEYSNQILDLKESHFNQTQEYIQKINTLEKKIFELQQDLETTKKIGKA